MLWDRGTFDLLGEVPAEDQLARGDLKFRLHGEKLNGEFTEKITPYIESVVRAHGVNLLFHRGTVAFSDPSFDISQEVITRVDDAERAKPTTPSATTSAPPAAAPKKAPSPSPKR